MTNPSGLCGPWMRSNDVAPLFPRHHLQPDDDPKRQRDIQVWPRAMRETADRHTLQRTAGVKHHLRGMAGRGEMLTTYEHDFALMSRPNPKGRSTSFGAELYGTGGKAGTSHRDTMRLAATHSQSLSRISAPKAYEDSDCDDVRSIRSSHNLGSRDRDISGTLGPGTLSKMHSMRSANDPMRLTVSGWGDMRWAPKTHPAMVMGMSGKRMQVQMAANIMNLRAPDLPFSTR